MAVTGIAGSRTYYAQQGILSFEAAELNILNCNLIVFISESSESEPLPSLLGRDFLNLCDVRLNHSQNIVSLDPLNVENGFIQPI